MMVGLSFFIERVWEQGTGNRVGTNAALSLFFNVESLQQLEELGVKLGSSYTPGSRLLSQLGDRLDTYENFFLMDSWPWQVSPYGTLQFMIDYVKAHPDQQLSLCHST